MATSLKPHSSVPLPVLEPSTDFPSFEDVEPIPRSRGWVIALVVLVILLVAALGFMIGRASAPASMPLACEKALDSAGLAFSSATAQLRTIEAGALTLIDGEYSESSSLLQDARLGLSDLAWLQTRFDAATAACRSAG
jgi:hypothetical protein